ncbi:hypothetical protein C8Q73DRAFT_713303 [Cubamyces lactineus]|nr:hypothetical protein C8Q73DRAFT_713303 [Cubamyces lactineus]
MQPNNSDDWYEAALQRVLAKDTDTNEHPGHAGSESEALTIDDGNRAFRTHLVACWVLSDIVLVVLVQHVDGYNEVTNVEQLNSREHG